MIINKIILRLSLVTFLNGCVQSTALLGPIYTFGTTGSAHQAGFSYGSNKVITTLTGKTSLENVEDLLKEKKKDSDLRKLVKKQIKETRKKLNLIK
jgi:fructose/tagatose bisphosphate aldolase